VKNLTKLAPNYTQWLPKAKTISKDIHFKKNLNKRIQSS